MRIDVDHDRCDGFGFCEKAAPQLLRMDDDDRLVVLVDPVPVELGTAAETAARSCPVAALRILA